MATQTGDESNNIMRWRPEYGMRWSENPAIDSEMRSFGLIRSSRKASWLNEWLSFS